MNHGSLGKVSTIAYVPRIQSRSASMSMLVLMCMCGVVAFEGFGAEDGTDGEMKFVLSLLETAALHSSIIFSIPPKRVLLDPFTVNHIQ